MVGLSDRERERLHVSKGRDSRLSKRRDCRGNKCTTVLHVMVYRVHIKSCNKMKRNKNIGI